MERIREREAARQEAYGHVRPIITTEFQGQRVVAVGNTIHWSKNWKTVPDFLHHYIKKRLGAEWGNTELEKPLESRHPVIQWYDALCDLQRKGKEAGAPDESGVYETELDGPTRAYLLLAYDLFVLDDHRALQAEVVRRLKHPDQFQGARYELAVAATMLRVGCEIEFEDESDPTRRHPEFVATHAATGQRVSVEAKSRHRPGVLGFAGDPASSQEFRVGIRRLLENALTKPTSHPYLIFVDANMPPAVARPTPAADWVTEVNETVAGIDAGSATGHKSGFNMLTITNTPDHYAARGTQLPGDLVYQLVPAATVHELADPSLLDAVTTALKQYGNVPGKFAEL